MNGVKDYAQKIQVFICIWQHQNVGMVKETRAKSTDLQSPETVEHLCGKCSEYAKEWAGVADKIWKETDYKKPSYENYKK